ncbi:MAG: hypothetical protein SNJ69_07890 [Chloroflexaceae bacterium]
MMQNVLGGKWLWRAALLAGGLWLARTTLLPGRVRKARLTAVSGPGPFYAMIGWSYGPGARPISIIFDLELGDSSGSVTTDGEALEAEVPLSGPPGTPWRITASATYRLLGVAWTDVQRFEVDVSVRSGADG